MKQLYAHMKACGKTTFLEVVAYSEAEGLAGARIAAECGCDILMGTTFATSILHVCQQHGIKYMPFVGRVSGRPSVGAYGIDLLGYRYTGDAVALNWAIMQGVPAPVCLAGSIDSYQRLDEVCQAAPWAFTIGSAFFENKFDGTFAEQIDKVCDYVARH